MCDELIDMDCGNYLLDGEVPLITTDTEPDPDGSVTGKWDIIVRFGHDDEERLETGLDLLSAKIIIRDYYAGVYAREDCSLLIRKQKDVSGYLDYNPKRVTRNDGEEDLLEYWNKCDVNAHVSEIQVELELDDDDPIPF